MVKGVIGRVFWVLLGVATLALTGIPLLIQLKWPLDFSNSAVHVAVPFVAVGLWFVARGTGTFFRDFSLFEGSFYLTRYFGPLLFLVVLWDIVRKRQPYRYFIWTTFEPSFPIRMARTLGFFIVLCGVSQIALEIAWLLSRHPLNDSDLVKGLLFLLLALPMFGEGIPMLMGPQKGLVSDIQES